MAPLGYGQAEGLAGHGVGYDLHEDPYVPNTGEQGDGPKLKVGMVIAIEPMLTEGGDEVVLTVTSIPFRTKDGSRSAQFEHTVATTEKWTARVNRVNLILKCIVSFFKIQYTWYHLINFLIYVYKDSSKERTDTSDCKTRWGTTFTY